MRTTAHISRTTPSVELVFHDCSSDATDIIWIEPLNLSLHARIQKIFVILEDVLWLELRWQRQLFIQALLISLDGVQAPRLMVAMM